MSTVLKVTIGADRDWAVQCWLDGAATPASFGASDTITAYVYAGQDQAVLFTLTAAPYTDNGGTGYPGGQIKLTITAANSATLEATANYLVRVWWTPAAGTMKYNVWNGELRAEPAAGTGTEPILTYCSYQDMLNIADWVSYVNAPESDTADWYVQRLKARQWMDWMILNNYRGSFVGMFEEHSTLAFEFGYAMGNRRSMGPSPSLIGYLEQNLLIVRPQIVYACAHYALAQIGLKQMSVSNQYAANGAYHRAMATREAVGITAEIDLTGVGIGSIFVNLGSTNTLNT